MPEDIETTCISFNKNREISIFNRKINYPGENQVLVRMKACGICKYDIKCYKDIDIDPVYSEKPGHEGVGIVEAVGKGVKNIKPGEKVTSDSFGGAFADYFVADLDTVVKIPGDVEEYGFWVSEPVACVVSSLRLLRIEPGDDVVVIGCGYMGLLIIQGLPKNFIHNLTAIDIDEDRLSMAKKFGADKTVNSRDEDAVQAVLDISKNKVDVVIEAAGAKGVISQATGMLKNGAKLCIFGHHAEDEVIPTGEWHMKGLQVLNTTPYMSKDFQKDLIDAVKLMEKGVFDQSELISHTYSFTDIQRAMEEVAKNPSDLIKAVVICDLLHIEY
ncbi:MAG TPA: hypothetical protein ENI15_00445 [Spirochaetes bacterium]|nr:hypothetical protein [Spirochaetota bacterium]